MNLLKDLNFNSNHKTPMYLQIANSLTYNINKGNIKMDEKLPSINVFSKEYKVSRDTVEKAYNVLKEKKIVKGKKGKGVYVDSTKLISKINVLFLINKLSSYKLKIYDAFIKSIGSKYHTDFEIYHCDESLFLTLMDKNKNRYDYYVIMPHFKSMSSSNSYFKNDFLKSIENIPRGKLIIMDNNELTINGDVIEIYQDFENDIYDALKYGLNKINKYRRLNLVLKTGESYPYLEKICYGFMRFCNEHLFDFKILNNIEDEGIINHGNLFIVIADDDLVKLLDIITSKSYSLGQDIGVLSYNETPFKRLLDIAVMSTDFKKMGETAASMIISDKKGKIKNPFGLIDRNSI